MSLVFLLRSRAARALSTRVLNGFMPLRGVSSFKSDDNNDLRTTVPPSGPAARSDPTSMHRELPYNAPRYGTPSPSDSSQSSSSSSTFSSAASPTQRTSPSPDYVTTSSSHSSIRYMSRNTASPARTASREVPVEGTSSTNPSMGSSMHGQKSPARAQQGDESKQRLQEQNPNPDAMRGTHETRLANADHNMVDDSGNWLTDFFRHPFGHMGGHHLMNFPRQQQMSVDIVNNPNEVIVRAECPGIRKEDVKINIDGDMLTISGERKNENYEKNANFVRRECSYGSVSRSIRLPEDAKLDDIKASYNDGVLNICMPRNPKAQQERKRDIPIQ